jgi:hypothetical protein
MNEKLILYHGTVLEIWEPNRSLDWLYVTKDIEHAMYHATSKAESMQGDGRKATPVVFKITLTINDSLELTADNDVGVTNDYKDWKESFAKIGSFAVKGIDLNLIEVHWQGK